MCVDGVSNGPWLHHTGLEQYSVLAQIEDFSSWLLFSAVIDEAIFTKDRYLWGLCVNCSAPHVSSSSITSLTMRSKHSVSVLLIETWDIHGQCCGTHVTARCPWCGLCQFSVQLYTELTVDELKTAMHDWDLHRMMDMTMTYMMYRVAQKSMLLILSECVNKTEKIGGMWTNTNSYRENEALSDIVTCNVLLHNCFMIKCSMSESSQWNYCWLHNQTVTKTWLIKVCSIEYLTIEIESVLDPNFQVLHRSHNYRIFNVRTFV